MFATKHLFISRDPCQIKIFTVQTKKVIIKNSESQTQVLHSSRKVVNHKHKWRVLHSSRKVASISDFNLIPNCDKMYVN